MNLTEEVKLRFPAKAYSTQLPREVARALEDAGLVTWVGELYGTHQYALTDEGRRARDTP